MERLMSLAGLLVFVGLALLLSESRRSIQKRLVLGGLSLQLVLGLLVLGVPALGFTGPLRFLFEAANDAVIALLEFTEKGSAFIFGSLLNTQEHGFIFAFQVLPTIIFVASLMAVFYHLGWMQKVVNAMAILMQKALRTSGAESLSVAANVFVGQTEAPLVVRPYLNKMTRSELFAVMTGGMATVAGGVLAAYVGLLRDRLPDIAGHLLTASVMSAPAALVIAKIMIPETKTPETMGGVPRTQENKQTTSNVIEAAAHGASDGLKLALNVAAMLLAFIALIAMINGILSLVGDWIGFESWGGSFLPEVLRKNGEAPTLSFEAILGWIFAPLAWLMGIPWSEAPAAGALLGEKVVLNEFVAYLHLSQISDKLSDRTVVILSYALCGFANFSSIAIQIGGIGGLAPTRRSDLARFGIRAVLGGSLAAFMTAAIAGLLI